MPKRSGPPPIVYIVLAAGLAAGVYWWFFLRPGDQPQFPALPGTEVSESQTPAPTPSAFPLPSSVPAGTTVSIDGSTSMVQINEALKAGFQQQYPGTQVNTAAVGSDNGIQALLGGSVDVAATSRGLTASEQTQGLVAVPIASDEIAIVVGKNNPFQRGLSATQVAQIFQGTISSWATLGGASIPIRVINRPSVSGTSQAFQDLVLKGGAFGTTPNITTLERDATTPILQQLGTDGIGYATYNQVADQQTVRVVAVDGLTPEAPTYPFKRSLYYVYKDANNPAVQAFLGYATSSQGQQAIANALSGG
ncbi:extracellular solute-binding protein [Synechococcales cyanobacterium C]|uniref:Extracellular solute-binding protein n=2 Tax=Petrachloros TaxID=2918834 RepID=A0A8K1ZWG8_9CYAN|nr:extracellular solute-binding protein [Petrachloros mirabilis ULC683]